VVLTPTLGVPYRNKQKYEKHFLYTHTKKRNEYLVVNKNPRGHQPMTLIFLPAFAVSKAKNVNEQFYEMIQKLKCSSQ